MFNTVGAYYFKGSHPFTDAVMDLFLPPYEYFVSRNVGEISGYRYGVPKRSIEAKAGHNGHHLFSGTSSTSFTSKKCG